MEAKREQQRYSEGKMEQIVQTVKQNRFDINIGCKFCGKKGREKEVGKVSNGLGSVIKVTLNLFKNPTKARKERLITKHHK